jgi:hypothetical protein
MKLKRREIEWRWVEEPKKEIHVRTLKEKIQLGLSDEEWAMICYKKYENSKCHREWNGYSFCDLCPKNPNFQKSKTNTEWARVTETEAFLNTSR